MEVFMPYDGFIMEAEDYIKLRKIANFLQSMEKCDADARRDLGHKIWLILNNVIPVDKDEG